MNAEFLNQVWACAKIAAPWLVIALAFFTAKAILRAIPRTCWRGIKATAKSPDPLAILGLMGILCLAVGLGALAFAAAP